MIYTREQVIAALQDAAVDGYAPSFHRWKTLRKRPGVGVVLRVFGTWNEAVTAAGLHTRKGGRAGRGVPNDALRQAFLESPMSAAEVARAVGWFDSKGGCADGTRVRRTLGLRPAHENGQARVYQRVGSRNAVKIAEALGLDPVEIGL